MAEKEPVAELEPPFSSDDATPWAARERLATAKVYWLSTIRHTDRVRPAGQRLVLLHWADGTHGEEPGAELALRDHDRL
jgi:hypothetical protein